MHEKKGNKKYKYVLAEGDSNQPPSDLWLVSPLVEPTGQLQSKGAQKCNNVLPHCTDLVVCLSPVIASSYHMLFLLLV